MKVIPAIMLTVAAGICSVSTYAQDGDHESRSGKQEKTYKRKFYKGDEKYRSMNPQWPDEKPGKREARKMERVADQATAPARQEKPVAVEMQPETRKVAPVTAEDRAEERRRGAQAASEQTYSDKEERVEHAEGRANMDRGENDKDERGSRTNMRRKARKEKWSQKSDRKSSHAEE